MIESCKLKIGNKVSQNIPIERLGFQLIDGIAKNSAGNGPGIACRFCRAS